MSRKQLARGGGDLSALGVDDTGCTILHLDMDAFFVSVELLSRPELRGREVIVGGRSGRGVVTSASYEARRLGVHAAMPMSRALQLCPTAVVIEPSHGLYGEYSKRVFALVRDLTPEVRQVSVDEGYVDVSGSVRRLGSPTRIARVLRERIREETGLVASVGIAPSMVLAKLASARAKPDGYLVVPRERIRAFLDPMPVEAMPGVGAKTQEVLARYAISTIGDLASRDVGFLTRILGTAGRELHRRAHGLDSGTLHDTAHERSLSAEHTFEADVTRIEDLRAELLRLVDTVAFRLRTEGLSARGVGIKYRDADFVTSSRQATLPAPSDSADELHAAALPLLERIHGSGRRVRLLGVRTHDLVDSASVGRQTTLTGTADSMREAETALDEVRRKFGTGMIGKASLMRRGWERGGSRD